MFYKAVTETFWKIPKESLEVEPFYNIATGYSPVALWERDNANEVYQEILGNFSKQNSEAANHGCFSK